METELASQHLPNQQKQAPSDEQQIHTLNTILSATTAFIYLCDKQGRYRFASEAGGHLLGMKHSDFLGTTWQELGLPAEFMEPFDVHRRKVMATGQTVVEEILFPVAMGMRWFEFVAKPIVDEYGEVESVVVSSKDITERKQAEEAIHRLASIVESSGDAIFSETLEGVITSWNGSAEKLYGYPADEVLGKSVSLLVLPDRHEEGLEIVERIKMGETLQRFGKARVREDGTPVEISVTISPILDGEKRIIGASTIAHDITEQKQIARELARRSRELERMNQELRRQHDELALLNLTVEEANRGKQFFSTMSHELRTPLASIIGFSQFALEDAEKDHLTRQQQNNLERILKNGQHLLSLINDALDLTKIAAGRMLVKYSRVDVRELLTSVVEETSSIALAQHLILRAEVEEGVDFLESNPLKLRQILLNLVSNALKFTQQGEVTVSARRVLSSDSQANRIALAVQDSGVGIPTDIQERVFEAFYQADGSYTRKVGGTGLGLSIVSQLTTLLGGRIELESAPGQGSTFTVILPIKAVQQPVGQETPRLHTGQQEDVPARAPSSDECMPGIPREVFPVPAQREATDGQTNVVLAVDDNPDVIALITASLRDTPYRVVGALDPLQVMQMVQELHPCAITLDVKMPDVNGWQILHQLKANAATASIPVVMITVLSEPTTGYVLGADAYVIKPFKTGVVLRTLQHVIAAENPLSSQQG